MRDNGAGIAPDLLPCIFGLFTQGPRGVDRAQGGLGIGLAVLRALVALHGGEVTAENAGEGHGSQFRVVVDAAASPAAVSGPDREAVAARRRRVALVDDNRDAAATTAMLLEAAGHEVRVFESGESLLNADLAGLDLFILDLGLPSISGLELAQVLRERPDTRGSRRVALTGYGMPADRAATSSAGFDAHLVKPVHPQRLLEQLMG